MEWTLGIKKVVVIGIAVLGVSVGAGLLVGDAPMGPSSRGCQSVDGTILSPDHDDVTGVKISSDGVTWTRVFHNGSGTFTDGDVFGYLRRDGRLVKVASGPELQSAPEIFGDVIAWRELSDQAVKVKAHNLSNDTTWTLPLPWEGEKAPRGLWQDRLLVEGSDSLYLYNLSSRDLTQITDYDPGVTEIWGDRVVWVNTTGDKGNRTHRLMLYDVEQEGTSVVLESSLSLARPDIYQDQVVYSKVASNDHLDPNSTWEMYRYNLSSGIEHPVATNADVVVNRENPRIAGDWVIYGLTDTSPYSDPLEGMAAYHVPSGEAMHVVDDDGHVSGDIWQNKVVYVRFDECTDFKRQVALTTLPEAP